MGREGTTISIVTPKEQFILDKFEKQLGITIAPKAMFEGRLVDPAQDRSAATMRSRREAARPSGAAPTRRAPPARVMLPRQRARCALAPRRLTRAARAALPRRSRQRRRTRTRLPVAKP